MGVNVVSIASSSSTISAELDSADDHRSRSGGRQGNARQRMAAALPAAPLMIFLVVFLIIPLASIARTAVVDRLIADTLPRTVAELQSWSGADLPAPDVYQTLSEELEAAKAAGTLRPLGRRLEYELVGGLGAVLNAQGEFSGNTATGAPQDWKERFVKADPMWGKSVIWEILKRYDGSYSTFYLRWAAGFPVKFDGTGLISQAQGYNFPEIYLRTALISLVVTGLTILIGYPVAYVMATASGRIAAILLFFILLPFWTSLLVRTMSWVVVLQTNGIINQFLTSNGLVSEALTLLYTRTATLLAMTQIQLPFTVLPMISVMRAIPMNQVRAARSLGAGPVWSHVSIFLPQALPGIAAGGLLTFVLCLGFYITPALVGGPSDQMVSFFIARFTNDELNWGLASALSVLLCAGMVMIAMPFAWFVRRHTLVRV